MTKTTKKEPTRKLKTESEDKSEAAESPAVQPQVRTYNTAVCGHSAIPVKAKKIPIPGGSITKDPFIAAHVVVAINDTSRQIILPIRDLNHPYEEGQAFSEKDRGDVLASLFDSYPPGKPIRVIERRRNNRVSYEIEKA